MGDEDGAWEVAGSKGRRSKRSGVAASLARIERAHAVQPASNEAAAGIADPEVVKRCVSTVRSHIEELNGSAFASATLEKISSAWQVASAAVATESASAHPVSAGRLLCLGVGSVETSTASRWQLALAHWLAEELRLGERGWADPAMGAVDAAVGETFGFIVKDCVPPAAQAAEPLLLYMPHCDRSLYESALAANLCSLQPGDDSSASSQLPLLARVVLVGNSFEAYDLRSLQYGSSSSVGTWQHMQMVMPFLKEELLPMHQSCAEAFNDLAVMSFPADRLAELMSERAS